MGISRIIDGRWQPNSVLKWNGINTRGINYQIKTFDKFRNILLTINAKKYDIHIHSNNIKNNTSKNPQQLLCYL